MQAEKQRHDQHEKHQRIGAADFKAHGGIGIGQRHGQGLGQRCVQNPGEVEFAHREGDDGERAYLCAAKRAYLGGGEVGEVDAEGYDLRGGEGCYLGSFQGSGGC